MTPAGRQREITRSTVWLSRISSGFGASGGPLLAVGDVDVAALAGGDRVAPGVNFREFVATVCVRRRHAVLANLVREDATCAFRSGWPESAANTWPRRVAVPGGSCAVLFAGLAGLSRQLRRRAGRDGHERGSVCAIAGATLSSSDARTPARVRFIRTSRERPEHRRRRERQVDRLFLAVGNRELRRAIASQREKLGIGPGVALEPRSSPRRSSRPAAAARGTGHRARDGQRSDSASARSSAPDPARRRSRKQSRTVLPSPSITRPVASLLWLVIST